MAGFGTAPHRIAGTWYTRTGRKLTSAGQRYWDMKVRSGEFDPTGHRLQPQTPTLKPVAPARKAPAFLTRAQAAIGDEGAQQQVSAYQRYQRLHKQAQREAAAQTDALVSAQFGGVEQLAARANKTINPAIGAVLTAISPYTAGKEAIGAARKGNIGTAALAASGILPIGPGKARSLARAVKAGEEAGTAGHVAERAMRVAPARSRITRSLVEKPADVLSRKFPNVPVAGARARQAKTAGRIERVEQGRQRIHLLEHVHVLPKKGSDADIAHFWWAQLPASERNVDGLRKVRNALQSELEGLTGGYRYISRRQTKKLAVGRTVEARNLAASISRLDKVIAASPKYEPKVVSSIHALSADRERILKEHDLLSGESAENRPGIVARWLGLEHTIPAEPVVSKRLPPVPKTRLEKPPPENVAETKKWNEFLKLENQDTPPTSIEAARREALKVHFTRRLTSAEIAAEEARRAPAPVETLPPAPRTFSSTDEPAYIGHRIARPRGAGGVRSIGAGKPMKPQGLQANTMKLLRSGGLRQSTHVAAEDWNAAQTYEDAKRIRQTLWSMGDKFEGHLPDGYLLINPHGKVVPPGWKHDVVAELGAGHEGFGDEVRKMIDEFASGQATWRATVEKATEGGYLNDLRIVPERDVRRFYGQFLPAGARSSLGKGYDTSLDVLANSLIFARLGYVPKNIAQNLVMAVPHQGPKLFANVPRAIQLIPHPGSSALDRKLWTALVHESGAGLSGIVAQETYRKALGAIPRVVTAVADEPLRVSAFIHEAALEKVIPKYAVHLSDKDKQALLELLTDRGKRDQLNRVMQRTRDAMADFERLTPAQRRLARRFLIVPGWLTAGTRYPIHFAATHPARSAGLAYVAAGEPGAPERLRVNKPIDEYLVRGLPSYVQAVGLGGDKVERVQSVLPAAIPADIGLALAQGGPLPNVAGYANPLIPFAWNTASGMRETSTGETEKVGALNALKENYKRLTPGATFAQGMIDPSSVQSRLYPDHSRLGQLEREAGVLPVKISRQVGLQQQYRERGMTQSLRVLQDKEDFTKEVKAAGYSRGLPPKLEAAYSLKLERSKRLDKIHAHGEAYQRKAFRADINLAVEKKLITRVQAQRALRWLKSAPDSDVQRIRGLLSEKLFGGDVISAAKRAIHKASAADVGSR